MSDAMGPLTFGKKEEQIFLGREIAQHQDYSEDTAVKIDGEVRLIVQENYTRAQALLTQHKDALLKIADELLTREVLDGAQVKAIAQGETLEAAPPKPSATTVVSDPAPAPPASETGRARRRGLPAAARPAAAAAIVDGDTFHFGVIQLPKWKVSPYAPLAATSRSPSRTDRASPRSPHARHGNPERHARFLRGRRDGPGPGGRPCAPDGGGRGGHHRHRR